MIFDHLKTWLNAGKTSIEEVRYLLSKKLNFLIKNNVKILNSRSQSAGVCKLSNSKSLLISGTRQFSSTASQRLNAKDIAWLIGFVEGDGWFSITKNGNYCKYEFGIEVSQRDIQLLYKIKTLLGVGVVLIRNSRDTVLFRICSKIHLKNRIIPIFDKYPMFTAKHWDYINFRENLLNNVTFYDDFKFYKRPNNTPFESVEKILAHPNFDDWLVGFIEAEGCFCFYKPSKQINYTASFDVCQTNGLQILSAIKIRLKIKSNIYEEFPNHFRLKTTSLEGIQNTINFLNKANAKLRGYKRLQYLLFLKELRVNEKYKTLNIPIKYGKN